MSICNLCSTSFDPREDGCYIDEDHILCSDCSESESEMRCGRCMDIDVPSVNADGMCDGCVEETNSQEEE